MHYKRFSLVLAEARLSDDRDGPMNFENQGPCGSVAGERLSTQVPLTLLMMNTHRFLRFTVRLTGVAASLGRKDSRYLRPRRIASRKSGSLAKAPYTVSTQCLLVLSPRSNRSFNRDTSASRAATRAAKNWANLSE